MLVDHLADRDRELGAVTVAGDGCGAAAFDEPAAQLDREVLDMVDGAHAPQNPGAGCRAP